MASLNVVLSLLYPRSDKGCKENIRFLHCPGYYRIIFYILDDIEMELKENKPISSRTVAAFPGRSNRSEVNQ